MKSNKFFMSTLFFVFALLCTTTTATAQYWRIHVQGISFLVPKGIQTDNTMESFTGDHTDFSVALMTLPVEDPTLADNYNVYNELLSGIDNFEAYPEKIKPLELKGFKGITVEGNNGEVEMYICMMFDRKKKNLYITVLQDNSLNGNAPIHAYKLFNSFE